MERKGKRTPLPGEGGGKNLNEFIVFKVSGLNFALSTRWLKEVIPFPVFSLLPENPLFIRGVCLYQEEIVPFLDWEKIIGKKVEKEPSYLAVTEKEKEFVGIPLFTPPRLEEDLEEERKESPHPFTCPSKDRERREIYLLNLDLLWKDFFKE